MLIPRFLRGVSPIVALCAALSASVTLASFAGGERSVTFALTGWLGLAPCVAVPIASVVAGQSARTATTDFPQQTLVVTVLRALAAASSVVIALLLPAALGLAASLALADSPTSANDMFALAGFAISYAITATLLALAAGLSLSLLLRHLPAFGVGCAATGLMAVVTVLRLFHIYEPSSHQIGEFALWGALAATIGGVGGFVLGTWRGPNSASRAAWSCAAFLPVGGILVTALALATEHGMAAQPPSSLVEVRGVEGAGRGDWSLVTGRFGFSRKLIRYFVNFRDGKWHRIHGPILAVEFSPDGGAASWNYLGERQVQRCEQELDHQAAPICVPTHESAAVPPAADRDLVLLSDGSRVQQHWSPAECPWLEAIAPDGTTVSLPPRPEPYSPLVEGGRTSYGFVAMQAEPFPRTAIACACSVCDLLSLDSRSFTRLEGMVSVAEATPGRGRVATPNAPGSFASRLGLSADGRLLEVIEGGQTRELRLP